MPTARIGSRTGPVTVVDGREFLYFGGTSYLGLQSRDEVVEAGCAALREFGVHAGTSRAGFGTTRPLLEVERRAAEFFGTGDAFYFGSGYVANHIAVAALAGEVDRVVVDECAHYCVHEAARLAGKPVATFRHQSLDSMLDVAGPSGSGRVLVMADAVGPSSGVIAPVSEYIDALGGRGDSTLLLDDAHGFGVLGPSGRGVFDAAGLWGHVNGGEPTGGVRLCATGTLAKALGGYGGVIPGTTEFVARLRTASHYFDGASPQPSAVSGSTAEALAVALREPGLRDSLRANVLRLRAKLRDLGLEVPEGESAQVGVTLGDAVRNARLHEALKRDGILVPFVPSYPGVPESGVLRIALYADHTGDQVDRLGGALEKRL